MKSRIVFSFISSTNATTVQIFDDLLAKLANKLDISSQGIDFYSTLKPSIPPNCLSKKITILIN